MTPLKPREHIRALGCGYSASHCGGKLLAMLQAFVDDSSEDGGARRLYLCGYINSISQWELFSDAWDAALKADPAIGHLHMVEAEGLRGEFAGWTRGDADKKVLMLAKVIASFSPWSIQCCVSKTDHKETLGSVSPYGMSNPYYACFYGVILAVARVHAANNVSVPVDFVFDEQGNIGHDAALMYEWTKARMEPGLQNVLGGSPIFRNDKLVLPLQAADMLAWHVRREASGLDTGPERPAMTILRGDLRHVELDITRPWLELLAQQMAQVPGVAATVEKKSWPALRRDISAAVATGALPPAMPSPRRTWSMELAKMFKLRW